MQNKPHITMQYPVKKIIHYVFLFCILLNQVSLPTFANAESIQTKEFVLFTMPKTGTHLLNVFFHKLTSRFVSWYSPGDYIRDQVEMESYFKQPDVVQVYWLHQPLSILTFISTLNQCQIKNQFLVSHVPYSAMMEQLLLERHCTAFFLVRDPRDYVISLLNHHLYEVYKPGLDLFVEKEFIEASVEQQITYIIKGTDWYNSTLAVYQTFIPWRNSPACCALKFETLIGPRGGVATLQAQLIELRKIPTAMGITMSDEELLEIFNETYGHGRTFVKGKAGTWKEYFTEEHKNLAKELFGDLLIELGYEKDDNW